LSKSDAAFIGVDKKEEDDKGEVEMVEQKQEVDAE